MLFSGDPRPHHLKAEMSTRTKREHPKPSSGGTPPLAIAAPGAGGDRAAAQQSVARQLRQNSRRRVLTHFLQNNASERLQRRFSPENRQKRPENQIRRRPSCSRAKPEPSRKSASQAKSARQSPPRPKPSPSLQVPGSLRSANTA